MLNVRISWNLLTILNMVVLIYIFFLPLLRGHTRSMLGPRLLKRELIRRSIFNVRIIRAHRPDAEHFLRLSPLDILHLLDYKVVSGVSHEERSEENRLVVTPFHADRVIENNQVLAFPDVFDVL